MKTTLENLFKGYANKDIKHNIYSDTWSYQQWAKQMLKKTKEDLKTI